MRRNFYVFILTVLLVVYSLTCYAEPLLDPGKGKVKIGASITVDESANLNGLVVDNDNTFRGDIFYGINDKLAVGLRHKKVDVQREKSKTFYGKKFSTNVDGSLKESDLLFLYRITKKTGKRKPVVYAYAGLKRLEGELYPKTITGSVTFMGKEYFGTINIEGKHKVVTGAAIGAMASFPIAKTLDFWADGHYSHYINGVEAGLTQKVSKNFGIDASYFYDRYRYKDYDFTDKGFRVGLSIYIK